MRLSEVDTVVREGWRRLDEETIHDRVRGGVLASACGDGLGAPFEGYAVVSEAEYRTQQDRGGELRYTDDTAMSLVLAEHMNSQLGAGGDLIEDDLLGAFALGWSHEPWRGYGSGAVQVFREALLGVPWRKAAGELFDGAGSFGNGGAMRVAPVALLGRPLFEVLQWARRSARVTHAHPLGQAGAALQAAAVSLAVTSTPGVALDPERFLAAVMMCPEHPAFTARLRRITCLLDDERPGRAARALGNGIAALEAVPAAILAFLRSPDDPVAAIEYAIHLGGDTDTIAAMTGAMVGARCGAAALPRQWLQRLEHADRMTDVADSLGRAAVAAAAELEPQVTG